MILRIRLTSRQRTLWQSEIGMKCICNSTCFIECCSRLKTQTRQRSSHLGISQKSLQRILTKDLKLSPYKIQVTMRFNLLQHPMKPLNYTCISYWSWSATAFFVYWWTEISEFWNHCNNAMFRRPLLIKCSYEVSLYCN